MRKLTVGFLVVMLVLLMVVMPACGKKDTGNSKEETKVSQVSDGASRAYTEEFFEAFVELAVSLVDYIGYKFDLDNPLMAKLSASEQVTILEDHIERLGRLEIVIDRGYSLIDKYSKTDLGFTVDDLELGLELLEELNLITEEALDSPPHA